MLQKNYVYITIVLATHLIREITGKYGQPDPEKIP
jgi:hypothetical protein